MQIIVTARHCEIPDDVREIIDRQFEHLRRFEPLASRAEVSVTEEKMRYRAEGLVSVDRGERVHGTAEAEDMRTAVERLANKLATQLRKRHDRRHDHRAPAMDELFGVATPPEGDAGSDT